MLSKKGQHFITIETIKCCWHFLQLMHFLQCSWLFQLLHRDYLLRIGFDTPSSDKVAEELTQAESEGAL